MAASSCRFAASTFLRSGSGTPSTSTMSASASAFLFLPAALAGAGCCCCCAALLRGGCAEAGATSLGSFFSVMLSLATSSASGDTASSLFVPGGHLRPCSARCVAVACVTSSISTTACVLRLGIHKPSMLPVRWMRSRSWPSVNGRTRLSMRSARVSSSGTPSSSNTPPGVPPPALASFLSLPGSAAPLDFAGPLPAAAAAAAAAALPGLAAPLAAAALLLALPPSACCGVAAALVSPCCDCCWACFLPEEEGRPSSCCCWCS
mmetsp:Transcript_21449/g.59420  ORF Transcript_21449/g.59420 Transcript_21449/m.59420 type:complete len:263 (+) Transcript_21449:216-1004(+)